MHSSRMRTARLLSVSLSTRRGGGGGVCLGCVCLGWGVSAQGLCVSQYAMVQTPPLWTESQTGVTIPCPKLHLWVVTRMHSSMMHTACSLPYRGSLSRERSLSRGGLCPGNLCPGGSLSRGSLSRGVSVRCISVQVGSLFRGGMTETPPQNEHGTWLPDRKWHISTLPPVNRMTDRQVW